MFRSGPVAESPLDPVDARIDALHASPPDDFVASRNALAKDLARDHDPRSASVIRLAKPTVPVWAINVTARAEPSTVRALLNAAEQVLQAHRAILGGADRSVLMKAIQDFSAALQETVAAVVKRAESAGHALSTSMAGRVRTTVRSLALAEGQAHDALRRGRVLAESSDTGLEALSSLPNARLRPLPKRNDGSRHRRERERRDRALAEARKEVLGAEQELKKASALAARLRKEAEGAEHRAEEKRVRAREAEEGVQVATLALEQARRRHDALEVASPA